MSDLIDRQKALDGLEYEIKYGAEIDRCGLDTAYDIIENLPSAEPELKWIPVTEALPKDTEFVLLTIRRLDKSYNQTPFISVGYVSWNQSAWWCAHDGDCDVHNVEVLAWMPLPEPWQGNDEYATD